MRAARFRHAERTDFGLGWSALGSSGLGVGTFKPKAPGLESVTHYNLVQGMKTSPQRKHSAATPARRKYVGNAFHVVAALLASQLTSRAQRDTRRQPAVLG